MSKHTTIQDVMQEYADSGEYWYPVSTLMEIEQGWLGVLVVQTNKGYDVWNIHPLRKGWQLVYTLEHCDPYKQLHESIASLKRLYEI